MPEVFERYMEQMMPAVTAEELNLLYAKCIRKKLRKKEMLLREGEVSHCKIFVAKGLLRNYNIGPNGHEYIVRFTDAGSWTTDPESYYSGTPSRYNIDALEPTDAVLFRHEDFEILKQQIPALSLFSEAVIATSASLNQKRVLMNISASAEEKYMDFIRSFPDIFNRVPLHMVASYLGVSRETLTRIRQGLAVSVKS